jgi:hypothetical protein
MIGVGEIYNRFVTGEFDGDDEVALSYTVLDSRYVELSMPMVNIRATLQAASEAGIVTPVTCAGLIKEIKARYFPDRDLRAVLEVAHQLTRCSELVGRLKRWFEHHYVDVKARDAREVLRHVAAMGGANQAVEVERPAPRSPCFDVFLELEQWVDAPAGAVRFRAIYRHCALHYPRFRSFQNVAKLRLLAAVLADIVGLQVGTDVLAAERKTLLELLELRTDEECWSWMRKNDLLPAEFDAWIERRARERMLMDWLVGQRGVRGFVNAFMDELRLSGDYPALKGLAAAYEHHVRPRSSASTMESDEDLLKAISGHLAATRWDVDSDITRWMRESGFEDRRELFGELQVARDARLKIRKEILRDCSADANFQVKKQG